MWIAFWWLVIVCIAGLLTSAKFIADDGKFIADDEELRAAITVIYFILGLVLGFGCLAVLAKSGNGPQEAKLQWDIYFGLVVPYCNLPWISIGMYNWINSRKEIKDSLLKARKQWEEERAKQVADILKKHGIE